MKNYITYLLFALLLTACGSRSTKTDIAKQSSEVTEKEQSKSETKENEKTTAEKQSESKKDITDKETTKTVVIEYGLDGKPTKQTTTETQKDKTDKSTKNKIERYTQYKSRIKTLQVSNVRTKTFEVYNKQKQTERQDVYVYLFFGLLSLVAVYVVGRYFRVIRF